MANREFKFREIDERTFNELMRVKIDRHVVSAKAMMEVDNILSLQVLVDIGDLEELRATRNGIVKEFDKYICEALENGDVKEFEKYNTQMSGIVCVIDNAMWKIAGLF